MSEPNPDIAKPPRGVFAPQFDRLDNPARIAILSGAFLSNAQMLEAQAALMDLRRPGFAPPTERPNANMVRETREGVYNTRSVNALNKGRRWALARFVEQIAPMLEPDIAVAVVPSHDPWTVETPIRELAQQLVAAAGGDRTDATACLVRHARIKRITFGGPSTRALHRATIRVDYPERVAGRRVLLLDDIAKSGQSLLACRALLYEAGAARVQMAALGRVQF